MGKKVKLEDLFEINYDYDGTFIIKVKPQFNKQRIHIHTNFGRIVVDHFNNEEMIEIISSPILDDSMPILNNINLEGFEKRPPEGFGHAYIVIRRNEKEVK